MNKKLPEGWKELKLDEVSESIAAGGTPRRNKSEFWNNGTIPWLKISDMKKMYISKTDEKITKEGLNNSSTKLFPKGTLVYSIFATLGAIGILDIDATSNQAIVGIVPKKGILDIKYLYYCLKSERQKIIAKKSHATQDNLNLGILRSHPIPIPPLETQKKIVSILEKAEKAKEWRKEAHGLTKNLLESSFFDMFLKDKRNFEIKTFKDISVLSQGLQIAISKRKTKPTPNSKLYITIQFLNGKKFPEYIENPRPNVICNKNDVLMTRTGNTGQVVSDVEGVFHNNFFKIDYDRKKINKIYLIYYLRQNSVQAMIISKAGQSTIPDLNHGDFYNIKIPVPPIELQNKFASIVKEVESMKEQQKQSKDHIDNLFNALMQKAFKGELEV